MKTVEIYKTRKDEIVEKTMELLPTALSGDRANRSFFVKIDEETNELTVDYLYYAGQTGLSDNCFYTIRDHDTPDPEDWGYSSIEEMDFYACGFYEEIEMVIDKQIAELEAHSLNI